MIFQEYSMISQDSSMISAGENLPLARIEGGEARSGRSQGGRHHIETWIWVVFASPSYMSLSYHLFFVILVLAVVAFLPTKRHFNIQTVRGSGTLFHWGPHNFNNVLLLSRFHCSATMKASYPKFILVCNLRFTLIAPITPPDYQWLSPNHKIIIGQSSAISSPYLVHLVTVWKLHCNKCSIHQSEHDSLLVLDVSIFSLSVYYQRFFVRMTMITGEHGKPSRFSWWWLSWHWREWWQWWQWWQA